MYLYSANLQNVRIEKNVFSDNRGYQIGYSELYLRDGRSWQEAAQSKQIRIAENLIDGPNAIGSPIESGGRPPDQVLIYPVNGDRPIFGSPQFSDPASQDFTIPRVSPAAALAAGLETKASLPGQWWKRQFPPELIRLRIGRSR